MHYKNIPFGKEIVKIGQAVEARVVCTVYKYSSLVHDGQPSKEIGFQTPHSFERCPATTPGPIFIDCLIISNCQTDCEGVVCALKPDYDRRPPEETHSQIFD